jgi:hypothetical protein
MLMTLFGLIADIAQSPDESRTDVKNTLCDIAKTTICREWRLKQRRTLAMLQNRSSPAFFKTRNHPIHHRRTYYIALRFVACDDDVTAGEATECFNPNAVVMHAEALSCNQGHSR